MPQLPVLKDSLIKSFGWVVLAYLVALGAATTVVSIRWEGGIILRTLTADLAATLVIFAFGRIFRNASFYDPYWSLAPVVMGAYWLSIAKDIGWAQAPVLGLVTVWGLRLTFNWASQWQGQRHEDWRYMEYRRRFGKNFWLIELVGIEMMPTLVVFLGCLSLYAAMNGVGSSPCLLRTLAVIVMAGALLLETTADAQLRRFVESRPQPDAILKSGLWKYSRHPNYLGEILFWWGLWLFVAGESEWRWWALSGPLAVSALFVFVSIPLMEKHNRERRTGYAEYARQVSLLIPWFPRR